MVHAAFFEQSTIAGDYVPTARRHALQRWGALSVVSISKQCKTCNSIFLRSMTRIFSRMSRRAAALLYSVMVRAFTHGCCHLTPCIREPAGGKKTTTKRKLYSSSHSTKVSCGCVCAVESGYNRTHQGVLVIFLAPFFAGERGTGHRG